jgi:hypothetical protein
MLKRNWLRRLVVCLPVTLPALLAMPRSASACSCWADPRLMFPAPGGVYDRGRPLWAYSLDDDAFELVDDSGGAIALEVMMAAQVWGGCGTTYQLRPLAELEPGARYELSSARVENTHEPSSFVVSEADTTSEVTSRVDVTATLEDLPPDLVGAAICGDAKLGARPITSVLTVDVRTAPDVPVILISSVEDPVSGKHESVDTSLSREHIQRDSADIVFTLPAEASRCAEVIVLNLEGAEVFHETLCPAVSVPVTRSFEAELVAVPAPPATMTTETHDVAPSRGCTMAAPAGSSSSALAWLAVAVLARQYTRRRRAGSE